MSAPSRSLFKAPIEWGNYGDVFFAMLLMSIVALLIIPLPTFLLDILLATNIAIAVVLLLTSIYVSKPLKLSTFPSILLVATLFRLALNVSSTRLILSKGYAGEVIASFGEFVVQGNYVVGAVIFLILTLIQFLVIAKGSERVAEVAARFTLDAMPGKQMSIDADLRAGAFGLDEARRRRGEVQMESRLFGAMDGAMKFVKGDAIAGIIITMINVIGGLIIGVTQLGMSAADAAGTYTLLTIGDGLVSQIPALLISITAGLIVTRVGGDEEQADLGSQIIEQLSGTPRVFVLASGLLFLLGITPGLPLVPFFILSLSALGISHVLRGKERERLRQEAERDALDAPGGQDRGKQRMLVPAVTPIVLEIGTALTDQIRAREGEDALRNEVQSAREALFARLGVKLPSVRIRFSPPGLQPDVIRILTYEVPDAMVRMDPNLLVAMAPLSVLTEKGLVGRETTHPVTGRPMTLLTLDDEPKLVEAGVPYFGLVRYTMLFVARAAQTRAGSFVGLAETQAVLDQLEPTHGALIDAVIPRPLSLARFTGVLKRLVEEGISIRDVRAILEALAEDAKEDDDIVTLTEIARRGVARAIVAPHLVQGTLQALVVDGAIEDVVRESVRYTDGKPTLNLPPSAVNDILGAFKKSLPNAEAPYTLVTQQDVRRYLRQLARIEYPRVTVLGMDELQEAGVRLIPTGTIRVGF